MRPLLAFLTATLLAAYPPLRLWQTDGIMAAFKFFAVDAFYYLGVAERSVGKSFYTFDGEFATNGFHPLWQFTLTYLFEWFGLAQDQAAQIQLDFFLSVFMVALGMGFFAAAVARLTESFALAVLASAPGPYYFIYRVHGMGLQYGAPSSFANGMESPLSILLFGAALLFAITAIKSESSERAGSIAVLSIMFGLITLARLDDIFIFVPFAGWVWWISKEQNSATRIRNLAALALPPLVLVGAYLAYNFLKIGILLPISGRAKSGTALGTNLVGALQTLVPFDLLLKRPGDYIDLTWRTLQMGLPMAGAAVFLIGAWIRAGRNAAGFLAFSAAVKLLAALAVYVLLKGTYNFMNVEMVHQGHWYYPLSILSFNAGCAIIADRFRRAVSWTPIRMERYAIVGFLLALSVYTSISFNQLKRSERYQASLHKLWSEGERLREELRAKDIGKGILEFDDGIISYALDLPAMGGLGFTLDPEAFEAKEKGNLLELAHRRGYNVFASFQYYPRMPKAALTNPDALREAMASYICLKSMDRQTNEKVERWNFEILTWDPVTTAVFIKFAPRH